MYLFDTNIFLEIFLSQKKSELAKSSLAKMSSTKRGIITAFSLHAIEAILGRSKYSSTRHAFIQFVEKHPYLDRYETSLSEELEISSLVTGIKLDFDDALQYYVSKKLGATLVTIDSDFRKIKGIEIDLL